jgi:DnaJ-domain-containing protein 1
MTDCFALLAEPRRPWLDLERLKQTFLARSADAHPDRVHSSASAAEREQYATRSAELNTAYNRLREPRERLAHLLELELNHRPANIQAVPASAMDQFFAVGQLCREADQFIAARAQITSPLLKVEAFTTAMTISDRVTALQRTLEKELATLEAALKSLNDAWLSAPPVGSPGRAAQLPLERLEELFRSISYLARCRAQLQERFVQLSM